MPDELASSYRDRLIRVNGWGASARSTKKLGSLTGTFSNSVDMLSNVDVLAEASGVDSYDFIRCHTMLPLRKSVISSLERRSIDYVERKKFLVKKAHCATRSHLYLCRDCIEEDFLKSGIPHWRRSHQIPGLYWCTKHHTNLRFTAHPRGKELLPSDVLRSSTEVSLRKFDDAKTNEYVSRFIEICLAMLELRSPIHDLNINKVVRRRIVQIREGGCDDFPRMQRGLLRSIYHADWLQDVFTRTCRNPALANEYIEDGLERYNPSMNGIGYALLLASMFKSSEEVMQAISEKTTIDIKFPGISGRYAPLDNQGIDNISCV
jgi:hypothetical protein